MVGPPDPVPAVVTADVDAGRPRPAGTRVATGLLRGLRPLQWTKNMLVLSAPAAAGVLGHGPAAARAVGCVGLFCVAASAVYLVNDVVDAEADRRHPDKCRRPVASGDLPAAVALGAGAVLAAGALAGAWVLAAGPLLAVVALYLAVSVSYSLWLKRQPVVELAAVASGFVLRTIAGGVATHVPLSKWFLVVVSFGALFVVSGKRAAEHRRLGDDRTATRSVLARYSASYLRSVLVVTASITVATYCLWAFGDGGLLARTGHRQLLIELTVVPITLGVLHVLRLADAGEGGAPEELVVRDRLLQVLGMMWCGLMAAGLYG